MYDLEMLFRLRTKCVCNAYRIKLAIEIRTNFFTQNKHLFENWSTEKKSNTKILKEYNSSRFGVTRFRYAMLICQLGKSIWRFHRWIIFDLNRRKNSVECFLKKKYGLESLSAANRLKLDNKLWPKMLMILSQTESPILWKFNYNYRVLPT